MIDTYDNLNYLGNLIASKILTYLLKIKFFLSYLRVILQNQKNVYFATYKKLEGLEELRYIK